MKKISIEKSIFLFFIISLIMLAILLIPILFFVDRNNEFPITNSIEEEEKEMIKPMPEGISPNIGGSEPEEIKTIPKVVKTLSPNIEQKIEQEIDIKPEPQKEIIKIDNVIENNIIFPSDSTTTQKQTEPIVEQKIIYTPSVEDKTITAYPIQEYVVIAPQPQPTLLLEKKDMSSIEIISPMSNKGLGREYIASEEPLSEANYIELGLLVRDEDGKDTDSDVITVIATDETQNKVINGTGNVTKIWVNGSQKTVHYYPYSYNFKFAGTHNITFKVNGKETSVNLEVK